MIDKTSISRPFKSAIYFIDGKLSCILMRIHQKNLKNACETENYSARIPFCECLEDVNQKMLQIQPRFAKLTETR